MRRREDDLDKTTYHGSRDMGAYSFASENKAKLSCDDGGKLEAWNETLIPID